MTETNFGKIKSAPGQVVLPKMMHVHIVANLQQNLLTEGFFHEIFRFDFKQNLQKKVQMITDNNRQRKRKPD